MNFKVTEMHKPRAFKFLLPYLQSIGVLTDRAVAGEAVSCRFSFHPDRGSYRLNEGIDLDTGQRTFRVRMYVPTCRRLMLQERFVSERDIDALKRKAMMDAASIRQATGRIAYRAQHRMALPASSEVAFLAELARGQLGVPPQAPVLAQDLWTLYVHWCRANDRRPIRDRNRFYKVLKNQYGFERIRKQWRVGDERKGPHAFYLHPRCRPFNEDEATWMGRCVMAFRHATQASRCRR